MQHDFYLNDLLNNPAKLAWACRRGMLELDVLLQGFLKGSYPLLSTEEKLTFIELLTCEDPSLFAWIMGHETPLNPAYIKLVKMIKKACPINCLT